MMDIYNGFVITIKIGMFEITDNLQCGELLIK